MTRKHYKAIAEAVKWSGARTPREREIVRNVSGRIANVCGRHNERFDRKRFLDACGVEG